MRDTQWYQIHRFLNDRVWFRNIAETVGSKNKGNSGFPACLIIAHGISDINRGIQMVVIYDPGNVFGFGHSGISGTEMTFEIFGEPCGLQEDFNIAGLEVADNKRRLFCGEFLKCLCKVFVKRSAFF